MKESCKFELACLKKKKKKKKERKKERKKNILAVWQLSGLVLSLSILVLLGVVITRARTTLDQDLNNTDYSLVLKQNTNSTT